MEAYKEAYKRAYKRVYKRVGWRRRLGPEPGRACLPQGVQMTEEGRRLEPSLSATLHRMYTSDRYKEAAQLLAAQEQQLVQAKQGPQEEAWVR